MFVRYGHRCVGVEPAWIVISSPTAGGVLADVLAISAAMEDIAARTIEECPYRGFKLALLDGLCYSPTARAQSRRGIRPDARLTNRIRFDTLPEIQIVEPQQMGMLKAVGAVLDADTTVVVADIYGLPGSWNICEGLSAQKSLLIDFQLGSLPPVPASLGPLLAGLDADGQAMLTEYISALGYSPECRAVDISDTAVFDIALGRERLRFLPPQDRFSVSVVLIAVVTHRVYRHRNGPLLILEYPEIGGRLDVIVDLIRNTPEIQWIVISTQCRDADLEIKRLER